MDKKMTWSADQIGVEVATPIGDPVDLLDVYVTAAEAYPALERQFLSAEREIWASFRIFDLSTRLRSEEGWKIGEDWFDLIVSTLNRGVDIHLTVTDFDPIGGHDLHRICWRTCRQVAAAREAATGSGSLTFVGSRHAATVGALPRGVFYPLIRRRLSKIARFLNDATPAERKDFLADVPDLRRCLECEGEGPVRPLAVFPRIWPATHHQKMAVFDRVRVYIGGLDLDERRYDDPTHDRASARTWADVQVLAEGPVVEAAQTHLESFHRVVAGEVDPAPPAPGFLRTLSSVRSGAAPFAMSPRWRCREIEKAHLDAVAQARSFIYLETQYFRHLPLARALARRGRDCSDLRLMLVLPGAPEDVAFEGNRDRDARLGEWLHSRCIRTLRKGFGRDRLLVASPVQPRPANGKGRDSLHGSPIVYVHSKVSIFDNRLAIVSSANLNGRSLRWDTETGLAFNDPGQIARVRTRVMEHWMPPGGSADYLGADDHAFRLWRGHVEANRRRAPDDRKGFLVPHDNRPADELGEPLPGIPDDAV